MTDVQYDHLRLIANPHRLRSMVRETMTRETSLENGISRLIHSESKDIYVNSHLIARIKGVIQKEMNDYLIEMVVSEIISDVTETSINDALSSNES